MCYPSVTRSTILDNTDYMSCTYPSFETSRKRTRGSGFNGDPSYITVRPPYPIPHITFPHMIQPVCRITWSIMIEHSSVVAASLPLCTGGCYRPVARQNVTPSPFLTGAKVPRFLVKSGSHPIVGSCTYHGTVDDAFGRTGLDRLQ